MADPGGQANCHQDQGHVEYGDLDAPGAGYCMVIALVLGDHSQPITVANADKNVRPLAVTVFMMGFAALVRILQRRSRNRR